ncbi:hypothetical protein F4818DRAFT_408068 [Hypoxylon cercidicola]|nr:hypothetical protein F4818DRAFT_408068 [Hypoxylon cercidicola]
MDSQGTGNAGSSSEIRRHDADDTSATASDTQRRSSNTDIHMAHANAVPTIHTDGDMTVLLEELRRVQDKLSDIDKRTNLNLDKSQQAKVVMNGLREQEMFDSFLIGLKDQDPPDRVALDLQKTISQLFSETLTNSDDVNALQRYIRFERSKARYKQMQKSFMRDSLHHELIHRYQDLFLKDKMKIKNGGLTTEFVIRPNLNHVDWTSFKACGELPEATSFVIDVLVGEPMLPDALFSPVYTHRRKPAVFQDEQKVTASKESAISGQAPLPERIRINSSVLLLLLGKIHGAEISKKGGAVVMVRPFKALSFYHIQLRDWYAKLRNKFSPTIDSKEVSTQDITPGTVLEVEAPITQATEIEEDNPSLGVNDIKPSLPESTKDKPNGDTGGDTSQSKEDATMSLDAFTHLGCLLEFMDTTIVEKQKYLDEQCKKVSFIDLWHLFKPGVEVIEPGDKYMQCYRVVKVTTPKHKVVPRYFFPFSRNKGKGETTASIDCVYVDFDGRLLGPVSKRFDISRFEGQKDVTSLPIYPLSLAKNKATTRQTLIQRGQRFLKVIRVGHMHYSGLTLESRDEVDSQVVVDFAEALTQRREDERTEKWKPGVQLRLRLKRKRIINRRRVLRDGTVEVTRHKKSVDSDDSDDSDSDSEDDDQGEDCNAECCSGEDVYNDSYVDRKQNEQFLSDILADTDDEDSPASLAVVSRMLRQDRAISVTDNDKVIMSYRVFGFVLRSRSWAKLDLNGLMDLEEYRKKQERENPTENAKENAFDNLVFPDDGLDRKTIVRSLVAQHFRDRESGISREEQSDIVRGKGKGLIILLHGAPGVGKTTTAEGIAELFNKPLFQITCGDLGTTAREVEVALETNFALANKWGSILLLDEADVFLARRNPQDFKRNGLVAVFLRVLEYYAGILFLTTNRIGDFDEAFSSRIHISLHYPALDYDSTIGIFELNWRLMKARFAHKNRAIDVDETKITGFVTNYWHDQPDARWNGRQIRNACQTALALAEFEAQGSGEETARDPDAKVRLGVKHMKTVTDAYLEFIKYLQDVRDADQEKYAFLMGIRRREAKGMMPEDPLAYEPSASFRRGQPSRLAEHRAARYNRPEQGPYQQSYSTAYGSSNQPDRQSHRREGSMGGTPGPSYQQYASPTHRPLEPQPQRGWNPGSMSMGGYYAGEQDDQQQQGPPPPPGQESFHAGSQYGQHLQP